jgi:hypothetical protein
LNDGENEEDVLHTRVTKIEEQCWRIGKNYPPDYWRVGDLAHSAVSSFSAKRNGSKGLEESIVNFKALQIFVN